jgi:hypothetical protein
MLAAWLAKERIMTIFPRILLTFATPMLLLGAVTTANADGLCGPGCHSSMFGACVVDGWESGARVWNECPVTTRPRPPCGGPDYVWSRRKQACSPRVKDWL